MSRGAEGIRTSRAFQEKAVVAQRVKGTERSIVSSAKRRKFAVAGVKCVLNTGSISKT